MNALAIRSFGLMVPLVAVATAWLWVQPDRRTAGATFLATLWTLPALALVQICASYFHWWTFEFSMGGFLGMPAELYLGWALLWGALPALVLRRVSITVTVGLMAALDLLIMPAAAPVVRLMPGWIVGELLSIAIVLIPAQTLARWTDRDIHLRGRVILQFLMFVALIVFLLPLFVLQGTRGSFSRHLDLSSLVMKTLLEIAIVAAAIGISAVQEFFERGNGTPFPYDPPRRIVRSGVYSYVRNPMQLSTTLLLLALAGAFREPRLVGAAAMAVLYGAGFASWEENGDLQVRFGEEWQLYRNHARAWVPRWRPTPAPRAKIYFGASCSPCREIATWLVKRHPDDLDVLAAEDHPSEDLDRVRYEAADGSTAEGVAAIGRALEHINLAWAGIGFSLRLPLALPLIQLIVDATGGQRRVVPRLSV